MHHALLLDEILRSIFEDCDRKHLTSAALTCKAWMDPALDAVWHKLDSSKPWLDFVGNPTELSSFAGYARRVKHIVLQHEVTAHDERSNNISIAFPNLRSLRLSMAKSLLPLSLIHQFSRLEEVDISLGFKPRSGQEEVLLCKRFQTIAQQCRQLRQLRLRGSIPSDANSSLCQMVGLKSVSLRLGPSLSADTLAALCTFPSLSELEVHAGHISTGAVRKLMDSQSNSNFPSLTKLHIRAKSSLVETLFSYLSPMTLRHLHIELDDETPHADAWSSVLQAVASNASTSLQHLALEHHFNVDDILQQNSTTAPTPTTPSHGIALSLRTITFGDMGSLRSLTRLEHFSCDLTLPPCLSDVDFEQMLSWWPSLKRLDFGTLPDEELVSSYPLTLSAEALHLASRKAPRLEYLSIPCSLSDNSLNDSVGEAASPPLPNRLQNLLVFALDVTDSIRTVEYLRRLFPSLHTIECTKDTAGISEDIDRHLSSLLPS